MLKHLLEQAVQLAFENIERGGRPFGAVLARDGEVIATGVNDMAATNDPTSHAELNAIRAASRKLGTPNLGGVVVYASGHPCPMCLAAMRMCGVRAVYFAHSNEDAEPFGLSTAAVYADLAKPFADQLMKIELVPLKSDLYERWHRG